MKLFFRLLLGLLATLGTASAQFGFEESNQVKPSLVTTTDAIVPGQPFTVLVRLEMKPEWHVYWQFGGDSGAPPKVEWQLPEGFQAGEISWPLPRAHQDEGDLLTYIYEGDLLLPVTITPPAQIQAKEIILEAKLSWLVCSKICVPGRGTASVKLPVAPAGNATNAELLTRALSQLPRGEPPPFSAIWVVKPNQFSVEISGLDPRAKLEFFPLPPTPEVRPKRASLSAPDAQGRRTITVPIESGGAADTPWKGLIVAQLADGPRQGWMSAPFGKAAAPGTQTAFQPTSTSEPKRGLLQWLLLAFAGGLILNLMPCVLPVIALKIFSFVSQAGEHPERVFRLGLAFVAGVFVFFLGISAVAIGLRAAGQNFFWGMQFADPRLMLGLIALVVLFAMAMFGVFEITLSGGAENALGTLSRKEGYSGAFIHGLFTTLLGTSCTAPLIGPVLGFAVTQPAWVIVIMFSAMAAGMSLPYFLLTWKPDWMRFLPKPGVWMERFKQFMGFVLLAVAVWLLGVFSETRGPSAGAAASWIMLLLALGAWIYGSGGRRLIPLLAAVAILAAGLWHFLPEAMRKGGRHEAASATNEVGISWEKFSPERVEGARKGGTPVFIDFTAEWCINCKVNEGAVLNTVPVATAFRDKKVVTLRADWTDFDPVIGDWLKRFNRIGVPLYVLYLPGQEAPLLFPELLSQKLVIDAISGKSPNANPQP